MISDVKESFGKQERFIKIRVSHVLTECRSNGNDGTNMLCFVGPVGYKDFLGTVKIEQFCSHLAYPLQSVSETKFILTPKRQSVQLWRCGNRAFMLRCCFSLLFLFRNVWTLGPVPSVTRLSLKRQRRLRWHRLISSIFYS